MPDPQSPVLPCPTCGAQVSCALQDHFPQIPCAGELRGYNLDPETRLHLCTAHVVAYEHHLGSPVPAWS